MRVVKILGLSAVAVAGLAVAGPAMAASDVSNNQGVANQAISAVTAPVASSQTASLIGSAIGNALGGGFSVGGAGGFTGGGSGGFSPSPSGGFSPGGSGGPTSMLMNTRETGKAGGGSPAKFGLWAQGAWVNIDKTEAALAMDGNIYNVVGGLDYKFNSRVLAGLALGGEWTDITTKFNNGTFKDTGVTLAPYVGVTLTPHWGWDLSVGHTWLSYDVKSNSGATTGSFDGNRWFGASNFTGNYAVKRWILSPKVGVMYLKESQDAYTDSRGGANASNDILFGNVTGGGKVGYAFNNFVPYAKLMGEWDFKQPSAVLKSNGQMSAVDDAGATAAVGIDIFKGPISGTLEGAYNSIGRTALDVWQTTARIRYQF